MLHRAMDRTVPRFIPPLPDAGEQNKYGELPDRRSATAQVHPPGNGLPRTDATARPCAVIGPDAILPQTQYRKFEGYPSHVWPQTRNGAVSFYRPAPAQYYTEQIYPPRNISPRHTFQENMSRFVVPSPAEVKVRNDGYLSRDHQNSNFVLPNGAKRNVSPSVKFCEGAVLVSPRSVEALRPQYHKNETPAGGREIQGPPLARLTTHSVPVTDMHEIPYPHAHTNNLYNADYQRYSHEFQNHGIHVVKGGHAYQTYPEQPSPYYIADDYSGNPYARVNSVRYEPYPPVKDRFVHARYDYSYQIPAEYATAHVAAQKLHESRKRPPPQPVDARCYPPPQKYMEGHPYTIDPEYRPKISDRRNPNGVPYLTDIPNYPGDRYVTRPKNLEFNVYDKNSQMAGDPRPVSELTKIKIDYNHCKSLPYPDVHYSNVNPHSLSNGKGIAPAYSYPMRPPDFHPYGFSGNYQRPFETPHTESDVNHQKPYYNPLAKIPTEFSPNVISPAESNASFDSSNTASHHLYQEDGGYVSQCSTASGQSNDRHPDGNVKNYDRLYNTMSLRPVNPYLTGFVPQNGVPEMKQSKPQNVTKCSIDLRQFVEMWDEEFEDQTQTKTSPDTFARKNVNVNLPQPESSCLPISEELYVLDKVTISKDDLHKYEHIQKVTRLPDNIKDYAQTDDTERNKSAKDAAYGVGRADLTLKFDNFHDRNQNGGIIIKSKGPRVDVVKSHTFANEPIDVEAKITQSIIRKEVCYNLEIKPYSPGKQVQMSSVNVSVEQNIDNGKRDCNSNDNFKKTHSDLLPNIYTRENSHNTPRNVQIMPDINFFGEVKNIPKTARVDDVKVRKSRLQSIGSSLPQIENDDSYIKSSTPNISTNTNFNPCKYGNNQIRTGSLKILERCDRPHLKIDNNNVKDNDTSVRKDHSVKESFPAIVEKYQKTNIIVNHSENIITKLQHHRAVESKSSVGESHMFMVRRDSNISDCNPSVIKSNYTRKILSPVDRIEPESNKISTLTSTEESMDLSGKADKVSGRSSEEIDTGQSNGVAQLHIPDISETVPDADRLDKVIVTAEIFSNTDPSKIIHTTLERVIEAIESNIERDIHVIPESLDSSVDNIVSYPDLAMDYTSASLDQEAVMELRDNLKRGASTSPADIQSCPKITDKNEVLIVEEKCSSPTPASKITDKNEGLIIEEKCHSAVPASNTPRSIEQIFKIDETTKESLLEKKVNELSIGASDKILAHSASWNISQESPICALDICRHAEPDVSQEPSTSPEETTPPFEIPPINSCKESPIVLDGHELPCFEQGATDLCQDSRASVEHLRSEIDHNLAREESPFDRDTLGSEAAVIQISDASPAVENENSKSLESDSIKIDVISQNEEIDIDEQSGDPGINEDFAIKLSQSAGEDHPSPAEDNGRKVADKQHSQTKFTNVSSPHPVTNGKVKDEIHNAGDDSLQSDSDMSGSISTNDAERNLNVLMTLPCQTDGSNDTKDESSKSTIDDDSTLSDNRQRRSSGSIVGEILDSKKASVDPGILDESANVKNDDNLSYSSSETWDINRPIVEMKKPGLEKHDKSKCSEINENVSLQSPQPVADDSNGDIHNESVECEMSASSLPVNNNHNREPDTRVIADALICGSSYLKSEDSVNESSAILATLVEEECVSHICVGTIHADVQLQSTPKTGNGDILVLGDENGFYETFRGVESYVHPEDAEIEFGRYPDRPISSGSRPGSLPCETSEGEFSNGEITLRGVEVSKVEHDGLELGGCWIDDIACVETVVSEDVSFPGEVADADADSARSWEPLSSDDDSVTHMLHYHVDSVGNILKDTNGNVILTNPLFELSKGRKRKITNDINLETWRTGNLQKYTKSEISPPPEIDLFSPSMDSNIKYSKKLETSERRKRKSSDGDIRQNKRDGSHKSERRKPKKTNEVRPISGQKTNAADGANVRECNNFNRENDPLRGPKSARRPGGRLLTKGAQKYIPPMAVDLKVHLPLPEKKLLSLSKLTARSGSKDSSAEAKKKHASNIKRMVLPKKKPKPKFEDVLKSIEISTISWSKRRSIKSKRTVPKMVIKKNEHGSHYASVNTENETLPDMTGSKWQPSVFIRRNSCIENMVKNKQSQTYSSNVIRSSAMATARKRSLTRDQNIAGALCFKDSMIQIK